MARVDIQIKAAQGGPLHPFCGAVMSISTPSAAMSIQIHPDAIQSNTSNPLTECIAVAIC